MALRTALKEFRFFTSTLVPYSCDPAGRMEILASQRMAPFSMSPVEAPR